MKKPLIPTLIAILMAGAILGGCHKKEEAATEGTPPPISEAPAPAAPEKSNAAPAAAAPEPAPAEPGGWVPPAESAAPAAPADQPK